MNHHEHETHVGACHATLLYEMIRMDNTWDLSKNSEKQIPQFVEKGRIGLRHMSTRQFIYRNFKVTRL
ncbi:MAG: hypothetical protein RRC34_09620 [Lentisphaeria bacterium]|nr:hypothetical protein [Lentisphaeria bacterium]